MKPRAWLFVGLPVLVVTAFVFVESNLMHDPNPAVALNRQLGEPLKKALDMNSDLAKLFISISTAMIGGVAYYIKSRGNQQFSGLAVGASVAVIVVSVASIFFGHLWMVGMRNQLVWDQYDPRAREVIWPERLQYGTLLVSLCWFGLFVVEREASRRELGSAD